MLQPLPDWVTKFANLPLVANNSWATNFSNAVDELTTNKLVISTISGSVFTFNKAVFKTQLEPLQPVQSALQGATNFATAWETAMLASTMVVSPGQSLGAASPPTTWSVVTGTVIDPASVATAKAALIAQLVSAPLVADATLSQFPSAFRTAFLTVTTTTSGTNSITPTPSPLIGSSQALA